MSLLDELIGAPSPFSSHGAQGMTPEEIEQYNLEQWTRYWQKVGRETIDLSRSIYEESRAIRIGPQKKWWQFWQ